MSFITHDSPSTNAQEMPARAHPRIMLITEPDGGSRSLPRPKTVKKLLADLGIRPGTALVIRNGELLTHDRPINPGETITVRTVISRG